MAIVELSYRDSILLLVFSSLMVHYIYHKYEPGPHHLFLTFLLLVAIPAVPTSSLLHYHASAFETVFASYTAFYTLLLSSIVAYRLSPFHPLAEYPGPVLAKVTKFWSAVITFQGNQFRMHKWAHDKYGPYVRVGPNELSIVDASVIPAMLGPNGLPKGPMWSFRNPNYAPNIISIRDYKEHAPRRRPWNKAFTSSMVKEYEPIIVKRVIQLVELLEKNAGKEINLPEWMNYFTFDFMGDMVFGGGFEIMREGDTQGVRAMIKDNMKTAGGFHHIPWIGYSLFYLPYVTQAFDRIKQFANTQVEKRKESVAKAKDLYHFLSNEEGDEEAQAPLDQLIGDAVVAIIAGSDTTSTVMSAVFYYLLTHPADYKRLQKELDEMFPVGGDDPFEVNRLMDLPFLSAVINETLRLQPPDPTMVQRAPLVGSGGASISGRFYPEGTAVFLPLYCYHRDPRYFRPYTEEFWPDRWLPDSQRQTNSPTHSIIENGSGKYDLVENGKTNGKGKANRGVEQEVVTDVSAFQPFSYGPANCAGKNLAQVEMRIVIATLLHRFEFHLAERYDPREWEKSLEDYLVLIVGELPVILTARY